MTEKRREILNGRGKKGHLLLSETDARPNTVHTSDAAASSETEKLTDAPVSGKEAFLVQILELAAAKTAFGIMAVQIDDIDNILAIDQVIADLSEIIGKICEDAGGAWQMTGKDSFGCFLPEADEAVCLETAEKIRTRVVQKGKESVSIGIAVYPTISFEQKDIFENAVKALAHADFFGPGSIVCFDAVSLNISGDAYYQAGKVDEAMAEYERALAMDAFNVNVHNSIGVCHGDRGDWDSALASFHKAMELDPEDAFAVYNAGYIYMQKEAYETALDYFERALKIDENIFELLFHTGRAHYERGRPEKALSYIERAMETENNPAGIVYRTIGDCNLALGNMDDAIKAYNNALKLRPDDAHSLSALAFCYETENRNLEIALVFGENAVEMQPENGLFMHRLATMYFNRNRLEDALHYFEAAIQCGHAESSRYAENIRELIASNTRQENIAGS